MNRLKQILKKAGESLYIFREKTPVYFLVLNLGITALQILYIIARFEFINPDIPLWYTKTWGNYQLAPAPYIFLIPLSSLVMILVSLPVLNKLAKERSKEGVLTTGAFLTVTTVFFLISEVRIISKASAYFNPAFDSNVEALVPLFVLSFALCLIIVPFVIKMAKKYGLVTDPLLHSHPGMILKKPSARAGGVAFYLAFAAITFLFIPINREIAGLMTGAFLTTLIGLADDKNSLNPYLRLFMLSGVIVLSLIISDLHIHFIANPLSGGVIRLDQFQIPLQIDGLKFSFIPLADFFALIWIMWVMNMLSWSNAVDGQFSGMTAITCLITALLALRLLKIDPEQLLTAKVSAVAAGAALGILPHNWHPSKIMWGFGATTMGLVIAMTSMMAGTKVAVATLALIVPTLDAAITMTRRILQKKSPVWGDKGHLHHRLLDMGLSQQKVAVLYWALTAAFGGVALVSSGRSKILALLTFGGVVAFMLVIVNLKGELSKLKSHQSVK